MNFAYLSSDVARTLAGPSESFPVFAGAEQFNGRPPMLHEAHGIDGMGLAARPSSRRVCLDRNVRGHCCTKV